MGPPCGMHGAFKGCRCTAKNQARYSGTSSPIEQSDSTLNFNAVSLPSLPGKPGWDGEMHSKTQPGCRTKCPDSQVEQQCRTTAPPHTFAPIASLGASLDNLVRSLPWNRSDTQVSVEAAYGSEGTSQTEAKTGTVFPARFCQRGNSHCGTLQGVGVRSKKIAGIKSINVYSLGLFVDPKAAKKSLESYSNKPVAQLVNNQDFYDALITADDVEKTLHLNIAFGSISSSQFWNAIEGALAPPMKQLHAEDALNEFARTFDGVKFRKGLPISFCIAKDGELTSKIDGRDSGTIRSKDLCRSLLGIYLGASPVSPDAKSSIGTGLASLVSSDA